MKLNWTISKGGAWVAGPYMVAQRIDRGWGASALFEYAGEPEPDNTHVSIGLQYDSLSEAMLAVEKWHRDVVAHLTRARML